ncbi:UNVERIFIED_CONTAM: hypothetical protein H355_003060 [Colinus virginianus]|nr:hypothetical protein H355_003060 [Colinus virginianus]
MPSQALEAEQELQLWKEINDACSAYRSTDSQPQVASTLEEICFWVMEFLQKPQVIHMKDYLALLKQDISLCQFLQQILRTQ